MSRARNGLLPIHVGQGEATGKPLELHGPSQQLSPLWNVLVNLTRVNRRYRPHGTAGRMGTAGVMVRSALLLRVLGDRLDVRMCHLVGC